MLLVKNRTQELSFLIIYMVILFASAFVRDFLIAPYVTHHMSGIGALLVEPLWKLLFWIVPTLLYIQFIERQNPLTYLKLSTNIGKGLLWGWLGYFFSPSCCQALSYEHIPCISLRALIPGSM